MAHQHPNSNTGLPIRPSCQQENADFEGAVDSTSQFPALSDITNLTSTNAATIDAHGSDDEGGFMHMSDDQLARDSETTNLRGARNRLWGTEVDQHFDAAAFGQAIEKPCSKAASNTSDPSGTSVTFGPSTSSAAARAARRMARRVALSANIATTDILGRLINGSARAPGQICSWVSSGFSSPSSASDSTNVTAYFDINDDSVFQPSVSGTSPSTISTTRTMARPSLSPSMYQTPPTSCSGSANASSTNVASTTDESLDSTDYQAMVAGTLFERGPDGNIVPTSLIQGASGAVEHEEIDGFEMIFGRDEATARTAPTTHEHDHGHDDAHSLNRDNEVVDETFCVIGTTRPDNEPNI
ncbi:hypothetical protein Sste5346_006016 [Sporothrix stenoceras]|uniref:Uncharacterized protein n=1 Tax=Sporothrix stenoceras TaxID=5173 RepID=A0ABR3Z1R0_9PEZI